MHFQQYQMNFSNIWMLRYVDDISRYLDDIAKYSDTITWVLQTGLIRFADCLDSNQGQTNIVDQELLPLVAKAVTRWTAGIVNCWKMQSMDSDMIEICKFYDDVHES